MDDSFGWSGFEVFHSVTLAKKSIPPKFQQTLDYFPEEQSLHLTVPDSPPHQKFPIERDSPMVHTPRKTRALPNIEYEKEAVASPGYVRMTELKYEGAEPIITAPQRLPDSPFPKRLSPIPYQDQVFHIER